MVFQLFRTVLNLDFRMFYRFFIITLVICSCSKEVDYSSIEIFGHGGNGVEISNSIYHDNTQESIDLALAQNGCDGVEIDIQLSKDGTAWLYHDPYLDAETSAKGCINSLFDANLEEVFYKSIHSEKLVRLRDLKVYSKSVYLDLKHANYCSNTVVDISLMLDEIKVFQLENPYSNIYVSTNFEDWLLPLLNENFAVYFETSSFDIAKVIDSKYAVSGFIFKNQHIDKDEVSALKALGKKVVIFEVRSPKGIRSALNKFPDMIQSDDVKAALIEKY